MKITFRNIIVACVVGASLVGAITSQAQVVPETESIETAFEKRLDLRIREMKISRKDLKALGKVDEMKASVDYEYDGFKFSLEFRNKGSIELSDLSVQYRCFYEMDQHWRGVQQAGVSNKGRNETKVKFERGNFKISSIGPAKKYKDEVGPFILPSWRLSGDSYFSSDPEEVDSSMLGLWVRVSFTTPNGETLTRDFCEPKTLSQRKKVSW